MARYNTSFPVTSTTTTSTLATPGAGLFTKFTGTSYTVTIPDPTLYQGITQTFYNAASGTITLSTPAGTFVGPTSSGTSSQSVPTGTTIALASDGTNYVIAEINGGPLVSTTINASSTVTLSPANANVVLSPTGSGLVTINPATLGTLNNITIGGSTAAGGTFTTLSSNNATTFTRNGQGTTTTDAAHSVVITGGVGISGTLIATGITETSSIAFKENVMPIENALDTILQLVGVTYDRKDTNKHEAGLIAEEVYKHAPDLVSLDENGKPYGIQYTKLGAYLIESIKSLKDEIDKLKGK
jgi:hypothetical protein